MAQNGQKTKVANKTKICKKVKNDKTRGQNWPEKQKRQRLKVALKAKSSKEDPKWPKITQTTKAKFVKRILNLLTKTKVG